MASKKWHLSQRESWLDRYLNHSLARWVSWSALLVSLILLLTTNSLYMTFDSEDGNERDGYKLINVTVDKGGEPWKKIPELTIDLEKGKTLAGGFTLFQGWSNRLNLRTRRPFGKTLKAGIDVLQYGFWRKSHKLQAPDAFEPDDSRAIRLVTMPPLHDGFSIPGSDSSSCKNSGDSIECIKYELRINPDGENSTDVLKETNSKIYPLQKGIIYFGVHEWVLSNQLDSESKVDRREELRACLPDYLDSGMNRADVLDQWIRAWRPDDKAYYHYIPDLILEDGQSIKVGVYKVTSSKDGEKISEELVGMPVIEMVDSVTDEIDFSSLLPDAEPVTDEIDFSSLLPAAEPVTDEIDFSSLLPAAEPNEAESRRKTPSIDQQNLRGDRVNTICIEKVKQ